MARSEVVWRETDRGTERSSGSLTGTSYTIDQLESTTIYTVTVRASNAAGTTDSQPITFSTGIAIHNIASFMFIAVFITIITKPASDVKAENMATETIDTYCDTDNTAVIIGGLVAIVLILAVTVTVVVILVLRCCCDS